MCESIDIRVFLVTIGAIMKKASLALSLLSLGMAGSVHATESLLVTTSSASSVIAAYTLAARVRQLAT
jgi:hypothetical protein